MIGMINSKIRNRKGFTLIELIVVIAILGILVAIAVPRLTGFTSGAQDAANDATARTISSAWLVYQADSTPGTWPEDYLNDSSGDDDEVTVNTKVFERGTGVNADRWTLK